MKISIYFLFYVAMILELLIFIVDRDEAERRIVRVQDLAAIYSRKLELLPPQETNFSLVTVIQDGRRVGEPPTTSARILVPVTNLISDSERTAIRYRVLDRQSMKELSYTTDAAGNCIINNVFSSAGTYTFTVSASVVRKIPDFVPKHMRHELEKELIRVFGDDLLVTSNDLKFDVVVTTHTQLLPPCP